MYKKTALLVSLVLLAGCTTKLDVDTQGPLPAGYKAQIVAGAKEVMFDPYSVRDAQISGFMPFEPGSKNGMVCVKGNAKNQMGAYIGMTANLVTFNKGVISHVQPRHGLCGLAKIQYRPFPELEAL